ncbi:MAG TPA: hypothetical protein VK446_00610 [Methylocystis sp.]|nr:hypothetical protein [Methylocystis sp.]
MADYYSLLARKIGPLPQSTREARQAVYDLARRALLNQLRSIQPPVGDAVIEKEGRALDEAIARLEAEADETSRPETSDVAPPDAELDISPASEPRANEPPPRERVRPAAPVPPSTERTGASRRLLLVIAALIITVAVISLAALRFRERPDDLAKLNPDESAVNADDQHKLSARIGGDGKEIADQGPASAPVARRAALLIGPKAHPDKPDRIYDGTVVWRLDNVTGDADAPVQPAIRADVEFPEAKMKVTVLIQKNRDPTLSASHTITVDFAPQLGSDIKGVKAIGALQMRRPETQSGERLVGIPVPTTPNSFLMGLMRGDSEKRNLALLRAPTLIDIPLQFSDDRIGTVNLEKGASGDRVFEDALAAWAR